MSNPIRLSIECPKSLLEDLSPIVDFDFAISYRILSDPDYQAFYCKDRGRTLILDNGVHELGSPLPVDRLLEAVQICEPSYVVAPDREGFPDWTITQFRELRSRLPQTVGLAACLTGETVSDRRHMFEAYGSDLDLLCFPYHRPRLQWFLELQPRHRYIHLLGMPSLEEVRAWADVAALPSMRDRRFSLDTAKPIKWGLLGRRISDGRNLRHAPISSHELLDLPRPPEKMVSLIKENLEVLLQVLRGGGSFLA